MPSTLQTYTQNEYIDNRNILKNDAHKLIVAIDYNQARTLSWFSYDVPF